MRSYIKSNCDASFGCDDFNSSKQCTQKLLEKVSTAICNDFNTKVDRCNYAKTKDLNTEYDKCFNDAKRDFIMDNCDIIKEKYVPLGLGQF